MSLLRTKIELIMLLTLCLAALAGTIILVALLIQRHFNILAIALAGIIIATLWFPLLDFIRIHKQKDAENGN